MKAMFPDAPPYKDYTPDVVMQLGIDSLQVGVVEGNPEFAAGFNRDYDKNGAPVAGDVKTGPGGLPGTPWSPNTASPAGGGTNPANLPDPPPAPVTAGDGDNGSTASPGSSSPIIAGEKLGDYKLGVNLHNIPL
jgi:hypothetical protein